EWTSGFVALAMCGGAWLLAGGAAWGRVSRIDEGLRGAGSCCFGAALLGFGVLHFFDASRSIRVGPPWIALQPWAWMVRAVLLAWGGPIVLRGWTTIAAIALATVLVVFFAVVYVPRLWASPHNPAPWTSGFEILGIAGSALALSAKQMPRNKAEQ